MKILLLLLTLLIPQSSNLVVKFASPRQDIQIAGQTTVTAVIQDDVDLSWIHFDVDEEKQAQALTPRKGKPDGDVVTYDIDTKQLENGKHMIRLSVKDVDGNSKVAVLRVSVSN